MDKLKEILKSEVPSKNDPNGAYTGKPVDEDDTPVQDADDL